MECHEPIRRDPRSICSTRRRLSHRVPRLRPSSGAIRVLKRKGYRKSDEEIMEVLEAFDMTAGRFETPVSWPAAHITRSPTMSRSATRGG